MHESRPPTEGGATYPDQIEEGARSQLDLLEGEQIARCWLTGLGFLVMTNLRCVHLWHKPQLFVKSEWRVGPSFFFYNLASPRVVAARFVELSEGYAGSIEAGRFAVRNPREVCHEIEEARAAGRAEWEARRARAQRELRRLEAPSPPPGATVIVREVVKIRCNYCGNLMEMRDAFCRACGAPNR